MPTLWNLLLGITDSTDFRCLLDEDMRANASSDAIGVTIVGLSTRSLFLSEAIICHVFPVQAFDPNLHKYTFFSK